MKLLDAGFLLLCKHSEGCRGVRYGGTETLFSRVKTHLINNGFKSHPV